MAPLPPNPQLQCLGLLMDLVPVHPIPRPSQQFGEFVISQTPESTEIVQATKLAPACGSSDSCAEPFLHGTECCHQRWCELETLENPSHRHHRSLTLGSCAPRTLEINSGWQASRQDPKIRFGG